MRPGLVRAVLKRLEHDALVAAASNDAFLQRAPAVSLVRVLLTAGQCMRPVEHRQ